MMDALHELRRVATAMANAGLEGVLIGNAGAALQGAPVGTTDLDFFVRSTRLNKKKILSVAKELGGFAHQPFAPMSYMYRIDGITFPIDMVVGAHGIKSFESLRSRSTALPLGNGQFVYVADLRDIIKSKKAAGREKDRLAIPILERTLHEKEKEAAEKT
jgi:hypothetical protein